MQKNTFYRFVIASVATGLCCFSVNSVAATRTLAQTCELGNTCPVPGNDGGQTNFKVTPATGTTYICEIKSDDTSLKFSITAGKHFSLTEGGGLYNANPLSSVEIKGRFKNPDDQNDSGYIKITKLPFSSDGSVKCYPKS